MQMHYQTPESEPLRDMICVRLSHGIGVRRTAILWIIPYMIGLGSIRMELCSVDRMGSVYDQEKGGNEGKVIGKYLNQ